MEFYAAGLNYTGLASNTHVVNPEPGTHFRLFDKRFVEAFPTCKLWRLTISINRCLKGSQGMGLDETYMGYIDDAMDGFAALGCKVILDGHDFMRSWKVVETLPGFSYGIDKSQPELYHKYYRNSDKKVITDDDWKARNITPYGSTYKKSPNHMYTVHVDNRDNKLRLSEMHVMGVTRSPKIYNLDGLPNTWSLIAKRYMSHPALWGYEIMNEPYNGVELNPVTKQPLDMNAHWLLQAPRIVSALAGIDKEHFILVDGNHYASASQWEQVSDGFKTLEDKNNQVLFAAHYYVDKNGGKWVEPLKSVAPNVGTEACSNFFNWLSKNKKRGILTEFGHPPGNESASIADKNLVDTANAKHIPVIQWAAGPGWGPTDPTAVNFDSLTGPVQVKDNIKSIEAALAKRLPNYNPV